MAEHILHPEYRDENRTINYPFADNASLISTSGLTIPTEMFYDAILYPIGDGARLSIGRITVEPRLVTLVLIDETLSELATATFSPTSASEAVDFTDEFGRPAGMLLADTSQLTIAQSWAIGDHSFMMGEAEFVASVTVPMPDVGVRGILLDDGTLLTGDTWLVGEDGVVLREVDGKIRVDIVGDPLFRRRLCSDADLFAAPVFLKTINQLHGNRLGEFTLVVGTDESPDTALRIFNDNGVVRVEIAGKSIANLPVP